MMYGWKQVIGWSIVFFLSGCSRQHKDREIKADIASKAETEAAFAGLNYTVDQGVVYLSGICPSSKERDKAISTVEKIAGVNDVVSNIVLGPVVLGPDFSLKKSVDSALKKNHLVSAQVVNGTVLLSGRAKQQEAEKVMKALQKLPVNGVVNRMEIH